MSTISEDIKNEKLDFLRLSRRAKKIRLTELYVRNGYSIELIIFHHMAMTNEYLEKEFSEQIELYLNN